MRKKVSLLVCATLLLLLVNTSVVNASSALSDSEITAIVERYLNVVGSNRYWNAGIRNNMSLLKSQADNGSYLSATTTSPCKANPGHSYDSYGSQGCSSNVFTGVSRGLSQCWGFADYIEYVIFKTTDGSTWTKNYSVSSSFKFRPGDLIWSQKNSSSQHVMVVYKTHSNGSVSIIEGNYNGKCHINTRTLSDPHSYVNYSTNSYVMTPPTNLRNTSTVTHTHSYDVFRYYGGWHPHYAYYQCTYCDDIKAKQEFGFLTACSECMRNHVHTHDKYLYYGGYHPHYCYYECKCGTIVAKEEFAFVKTCSECMNNHTHTHDKYLYYGGNHPHYCYYECRCGEIIAKQEFAYSPTCKFCVNTPEKPKFNNTVSSYKTNDSITFSWDATANTTHYNFVLRKLDTNGEYKNYERIFYAESGITRTLEEGQYYAIMESKNSNFWNADGTDWLTTTSDCYYFIVEDTSRYTAPIVKKKGKIVIVENDTHGIEPSGELIVAAYKEGEFVTLKSGFNSQTKITVNLEGGMDEIKIMIWGGTGNLTPLCEPIVIPQSEWIIE